MAHRIFITVVVGIMLISGLEANGGVVGVPDLELSWVDCPMCPADIDPCFRPIMFNVPNGMGSAFTEARNLEGPVDATLVLYLRDGNNDPVVGFPAEDLVLTTWPGMFVPCLGGTTADSNTDANGMTTWVNPLRAGGWSEGPMVVMVDGQPLVGDLPLFWHNSPDNNGDLIVNLLDLQLFAQDYYGGYTFRSDFLYDGIINLSDVPKFAQNYGAACP